MSPEQATQLEVAALLGVSDSLVSDYRRRIEQKLRALTFSEVEEAKQFEMALREQVKTLVLYGERKRGRGLESEFAKLKADWIRRIRI